MTHSSARTALPRQTPAARGPETAAPRGLKVSVIITNYNYGAYLGQAVASVLAQTHADVECIVVDDGSTDNSQAVMASFAGIAGVLLPNGGQMRAARAGLARASGDIVIFLDSDDFLFPDACACVAAQWRAGLSALFYRLQVFEEGEFRTRFWPPGPFRRGGEAASVLEHGFLPSAPTSGNAFSRAHAEAVFEKDWA